MRLLRIYVDGYKRFASKTGFTVDAPVVALVGPNEAGKSSVLEALRAWGTGDAIPRSRVTRGAELPDDHSAVSAVFLLEPEDHEALAEVREARELRTVTVYKRIDGGRRMRPNQPVVRDQSLRERIAADLRRAAASPALRDAVREDEEPLSSMLEELAGVLEAAGETLTDDDIERIQAVAQSLKDLDVEPFPAYVKELPKRLSELAGLEEQIRPSQRVANALFPRLPAFEWFSQEARALRSSYELEAIAEVVPVALGNLARLAQLDLARLAAAVDEGQRGEVQELQERANARLGAAYAAAWSQGPLSVSFNVEEGTLHIFVREESGSFWDISERSDGLRWFVALVALLAQTDPEHPPILLIDEAEQHLHYDAQADLIRTFQDQTTAAGVIYTTHSAGCLPQDIGSGVKVVKRLDIDQSEIKNGFWVDDSGTPDEAGFSSVLMEMGASTLAFSAARFAVFCEGRVELVLLPTLLREACEWRVLPFQVAPGLASVTPYSVPSMDLAAARVAFLVDGDKAGAGIAKKLTKAGVPAERILRLPVTKGRSVTIEDFIDPVIHRQALRDEAHVGGVDANPPAATFSANGRAARIERWYQSRDLRQPGKVAVAHRVVSAAREGANVCDPRRRAALKRLGEQMLKTLE